MEITLKIDRRNKQAKMLYEYLKTLPFVEIKEKDLSKPKIKSPYDPEFVAEIKRRDKACKGKKLTRVNPDDVWGSIL